MTEQTASEKPELETREEMWLISHSWELVQPGVKSSQLGSGICTLIDVLFFFVGLCFNFSKGDVGISCQGHPGVPTVVESHFLLESFMTGHGGRRPGVTLLPSQAHPAPSSGSPRSPGPAWLSHTGRRGFCGTSPVLQGPPMNAPLHALDSSSFLGQGEGKGAGHP